MERRPGSPPVAAKFRRALRWLGLVAPWLGLLPATPMCALPRAPASGPEVPILSTGPFCAKVARDVQVSADHLVFNGGGYCRFCPERVTVDIRAEAPSLAAEWGLVGRTPVARRIEQTGCGASGCNYSLTA